MTGANRSSQRLPRGPGPTVGGKGPATGTRRRAPGLPRAAPFRMPGSRSRGVVGSVGCVPDLLSHPGPHRRHTVFRKVLVANRGEIAVRAFRAATELGAQTVAVFPHEDRKSEHRLKADEAYEIGEPGHPVRAYLDPEAITRVAVEAGARRDLPRLRLPLGEPGAGRGLPTRGGISFIGRPGAALPRSHRQQGDGRGHAAREAGVPVLEIERRSVNGVGRRRSYEPRPRRLSSRSSSRP